MYRIVILPFYDNLTSFLLFSSKLRYNLFIK